MKKHNQFHRFLIQNKTKQFLEIAMIDESFFCIWKKKNISMDIFHIGRFYEKRKLQIRMKSIFA